MPSQPLSPTRNLSRDSLRSLAPLLNDLPPPSPSAVSSSRPQESFFQTKNQNLPLHLNPTYSQPSTSPPSPKSILQPDRPRPLVKSYSLDSSSGQSESPPTPSGPHLHSISPASYHAYHPEWTSVSSPILASSFDHPDYHTAPPSKRPRQLLNPEPRPPFRLDSQHDTLTCQHPASTPSRNMPQPIKTSLPGPSPAPAGPETRHPLNPRSGSCSPSSRETDEPTYVEHSNDHALGAHPYSHLVTTPHPILLDEDRGTCSRPLKNTKRAAQNRAAQRAFRERKDRYVRELEARSVQLDEYLARFGLLEERERDVATREAELRNAAPQSVAVDDRGGKPTTSDVEKLNRINRLEHQLESSRAETTRLRAELMKFHREEEINQSRKRVMDWEKGTDDVSMPRTGSASDADTDVQTPASSGSPSILSASRKSTRSLYQQSWSRDEQNTQENGGSRERIGKDNHKPHGNPRTTLSITTETQRKPMPAQEYSRNGWSDEGDSADSLPISLHQARRARPEIGSSQFDQIRHHRQQHFATCCASESHTPADAMKSHPIPLRKATTLDAQDQSVRLPGIQSHSKHTWDDKSRRH